LPNVFQPDFDDPRERPGFQCRRARVGWQAGSARLGASVWDIPPGQAAYPYHYHLTDEELLFVLNGRPSLRGPSGWRELEEGEAIAFAIGEAGAHQIVNRTDGTVRMLVVSTSGAPDICVYPDSNKLGAFERVPGGGGLGEMFDRASAVGYWEGEVPPVGDVAPEGAVAPDPPPGVDPPAPED
jgi:uncharacterized cupin superfamily protein